MSIFFVAGTDTDVGKTVASRAIIQALQEAGEQIVGFKPIATGQEEAIYTDVLAPADDDYGRRDNRDVLTLMDSSREKLCYQDVNSYSFEHPFPMLSAEGARIRLEKIDADLARLADRYDNVLVEGSFGWFSPMNGETSFAQWVVRHKMPVVLVVGIKEGCMNHALLTVNAITTMGLHLVGWIANRINPGMGYYAEIIRSLQRDIRAPLLGKIPYIHKPESQDVGRFITGVEQLRSL